MITVIKQKKGSYKITVEPNEDHNFIGYTYKPLLKYLGICPHRFVRGVDSTMINKDVETPAITRLRGNNQGWYDKQPVKVQKIFSISEGFEITLDEGYRPG